MYEEIREYRVYGRSGCAIVVKFEDNQKAEQQKDNYSVVILVLYYCTMQCKNNGRPIPMKYKNKIRLIFSYEFTFLY